MTGTRHTGLILIGAFKILKGVLLVGVGIGALKLLNRDVSDLVATWIEALRIDPDNRYIHKLLVKLLSVDNRKLKEISAGTFFYAALVFTEGGGLLSGRRWAQYFTTIITASFLPIEVFELMKKFSMTKVMVIALNVLIVCYLVVHLRRHKRRE